MSDLVFLFPGQGSQVVGMGAELYEKSALARETFDLADEVLGYRLSEVCFRGSEEELKLTHNTQPALLTVSYILYRLLGSEPVMAAGHSLGEYSALVCAGALSYEDAVLLVHKRGRYMQEAVPVGVGAMAAVMGADIETVKRVCADTTGVVNLANWNSAGQVVLSGEKKAVEEAVEKIAAPRATFLPVSAPFHSELMAPAEEKLSRDLDGIAFFDLRFPVINNVEAREVTTGGDARRGLKLQVSRPVLWHATMLRFIQDKGAEKFVEIGSGRVLAGLAKRTCRELDHRAEIVNIETLEDISAFAG